MSVIEGRRRGLAPLETTAVLFVSLPIVLFLLAEPFASRYVFQLRAVELFDLWGITPSLSLSLLAFHFLLLDLAPRHIRILSILLILTFTYAQAVHWTANLLNTFLTEWEIYKMRGVSKDSVPSDLYQLIYWLDEYISHLILFAAMYGQLILCVLKGERVASSISGRVSLLFFVGTIGGLSHTVAFIESQHPQLSPLLGLPLLAASIYRVRRDRRLKAGSFLETVRSFPFLAYTFAEAVNLQIGPLVYIYLFGSLVEPSQLGGWWTLIRRVLPFLP